MSKKYYGVRNGRKIGVFDSWDECNKHVKGYKGAEFKSFKTYEEAKSYVTGTSLIKKNIEEIKEDEIIAYVDGSYNINTGDFGYGIVLITSNETIKLKEKFTDENLSKQRNVAGEVYGSIMAVKKAIELDMKKIYIYYDYKGIEEWAKGNWKTNIDLTKSYKRFIDDVKDKIDIEFVKVKAHSNDKYNDMADELAKEAVGIL